VDGLPGIELIRVLRTHLPSRPIIHMSINRSIPGIEAQVPEDVPVPREPFTADKLRAQVAAMLDGDRKQITH
jgi:hypothetical protein